jgi:alanine racemase
MSAPSRPAWIEIDLGAISNNISAIQSFVGAKTDILAVVKANAYGHGLVPASRAALQGGAKALGVALLQEGEQLRAAGIEAPILVMGPCLPQHAPALIQNDLATVVSGLEGLQALTRAARDHKTRGRIHVKIDTGMGRIGCSREEGLSLVHEIVENPNLILEGIMSHIAWENKQDHEKVRAQIDAFSSFLKQCHPIRPHWRHLANSATALQFPEAHLDLVRVGLLTYGLPPLVTNLTLKPALSFKARITQLRSFLPGQTLSYGGTCTLSRPSRIATLPLGYADGYNRHLSNRAKVLVQDQRCPVVGTVCMDLTLVDVTDVPKVKLGDEVILIGPSQNDSITAKDLANWSDTIVHEIVSQFSPRLPRYNLP